MAKTYTKSEFIERSILADETESVEAYVAKWSGKLDTMYENLCADNLKVSVGFYEESEAYCCTLVPTEANKTNNGYILSAWSDNPIEAVLIAAYKHHEIFNGKWTNERKSKSRWG